METAFSDAGTLRKQLTLTLAQTEIDQRRHTLLTRYAGQAKIAGFRPGHAPTAVVEKRFGKAATDEAIEALISEGLQKAIQDAKLVPIGPITVDESRRDAGVRQVVSFDIRPTVTLPAPNTLRVPVEDPTPTAAAIDAEIDIIRHRLGDLAPLAADATINADDIITLTGSISAKDDPAQIIRQIHDLQHLVGGYPLLGKEPAEVVEICAPLRTGGVLAFDTVLPANFTPEPWAGKPATVSLTISTARRRQPVVLDQTHCQRLGVADEAALRERVTTMLQHQAATALRQRQTAALLDRLVEACEFELPPVFVDRLVTDDRQRLAAAAEEPADGPDRTAPEDEAATRVRVERDVRRAIIVECIADQLGIKTTRGDIDQQVQLAAYRSGRRPDEIANQLQRSGRLFDVAQEIRSNKALDAFLDQVLAAAPAPGSPAADEPATKPAPAPGSPAADEPATKPAPGARHVKAAVSAPATKPTKPAKPAKPAKAVKDEAAKPATKVVAKSPAKAIKAVKTRKKATKQNDDA